MNATTNATRAYEAQRERVERAIERLREILAAKDDEQARDPKNWEFAGSMQHVATTLEEEVCAFLSGQAR